jgi:hypothetical protein
MTLLQRPLFHVGHHYIRILGLIAFIIRSGTLKVENVTKGENTA